MSNAIGIMGCGWLGLPLAKTLLAGNRVVHGSTTSREKLEELKNEGVVPFRIVLGETGIEGAISNFLQPVEVLIVNVPPKLRGGATESYVHKMKLLHSRVANSRVKKVVFISSTSIYGDIQGEVTEESKPHPVTASGKQLLITENIFREDTKLETAIIRFGGLIGPNRHPVNYLAGKKGLPNGNDPINLIHLNDCIHMISTVLKNNYWNEIFNGVYPDHPVKEDYYTSEAQKRGLPIPEYGVSNRENVLKIIKSRCFLTKNHHFYTPIK